MICHICGNEIPTPEEIEDNRFEAGRYCIACNKYLGPLVFEKYSRSLKEKYGDRVGFLGGDRNDG